jgi:hypothetical protein
MAIKLIGLINNVNKFVVMDIIIKFNVMMEMKMIKMDVNSVKLCQDLIVLLILHLFNVNIRLI